MRNLGILACTLIAATGCATDDSPDAEDDVAVVDGKVDGASLSECQVKNILKLLNEGATASQLRAAGVHNFAAKNLVKVRDGADGRYGTEDDVKYETIKQVDDVPYVGNAAFDGLIKAVAGMDCSAGVDIYKDARDVTKPTITFPAGTVAPTDYEYPDGGDTGFDLGGTEFWQKWSGGHNPTYSFEEGTDAGRLCMQASAIRFTEMMKNPPTELVRLMEASNWDGSFFNWNDDFSNPSAFGNASGARLWAWQTYLIKWISQTGKDGVCHLPTRDMVIRAATNCQGFSDRNNMEIQGCRS